MRAVACASPAPPARATPASVKHAATLRHDQDRRIVGLSLVAGDYRLGNGEKEDRSGCSRTFESDQRKSQAAAVEIRRAAAFGSKGTVPCSKRSTMNRLRKSMILVLWLMAAGGLFRPATSRADDGATGFIEQRQAKVSALLREPPSPSREQRVGVVLDSMIDYDDLAKRSLENHW